MSRIKLTSVTFNGTKEQEAELRKFLREIKDKKGNLMPAMQHAQGIYGYLPIEVQKVIGEELNIPLEEVFGVATFYSQFSLNPKGEYNFAVCLGTACYVKGSGDVFAKLQSELGIKDGETTPDGKYSINSTRCVGCCGLAPVMTVNSDVYGKITPADVPGIIAKYRT